MTTPDATLPNNILLNPVIPFVPTIIKSTSLLSAYSRIADTIDIGVVMTSVFIFLTWSLSFYILFVIRLNHFSASFLYFVKYAGEMAPKKPDESPYLILDGTTDKKVSSDPYFFDIFDSILSSLK